MTPVHRNIEYAVRKAPPPLHATCAARAGRSLRQSVLVSLVVGATLMGGPLAFAQEVVETHNAPPALSTVKVPKVKDLGKFVANDKDAILLGKAWFWDRQAGSDGQACASCHFHAGGDNRVKNQLSPGLNRENNPDMTFQPTASGGQGGPNYTLKQDDFPFHQFHDPNDRSSGVKFHTNDIASSQGTFGGTFQAVPDENDLNDVCLRFPDPVFHVNGIGVRKVEPRHTPGVINAVFNFRNFWDGRANNVFNGVDPFGLRNSQARIFKKDGSTQMVDLRNSSLASQAVGPPESDFEMICTGRKFAQMGQKLIPRRALKFQEVHPNDSVLGGKVHSSGMGLKDTYKKLIEKAFKKEYWEAGLGSGTSGTVRDNFNSVSYSNNDGPQNWAGNWIEDDDFGQGASSGQVAIEGNELTLEDQPNTGTQPSARREVNLTGATSATLSFDFSTTSGVDSSDSVIVEVSGNGGGNWTPLETFSNISGSSSGSRNFDISGSIAPNTQVRFRVIQNYGGSNELFNVDNVEISYSGSGGFGGFTQMEANFSLFWGIAVQMYQATLVSDQAPYDQFAAGHSEEFDPEDGDKSKLTDGQFRGLKIFLDKGKCINCHKGSEFSGAASVLQAENQEGGLVERMLMGDGGVALYDNGFYNIGVTPTNEDISVGGNDPWGNPLSFTKQFVQRNFVDPIHVDPCKFEVPFSISSGDDDDDDDNGSHCSTLPSNLNNERQAVRGAFKTAILRNVELTGPFMHNGGMKSLTEVVEFYNRGGNFHNNPELDSDITDLELNEFERADLVAFLLALTDPRVKNEQAPFDHPQIQVPNGHPNDETFVLSADGILADDDLLNVPAVGKNGRSAEGLPPLQPFFNIVLDKDPPEDPNVPPDLTTVEVRISKDDDDAEEGRNGNMYRDSSDLELVYDSYNNQGNQTVGLRFKDVVIPQGATIVNAFVQFQADESDSQSTSLTIRGEAHDDAKKFENGDGNISSRNMTSASVGWSPGSWSTGQAGPAQQTPNLAAVIQEIVDRGGWNRKALVLIITGSGQRVAESHDGKSSAAPLLHVEFHE